MMEEIELSKKLQTSILKQSIPDTAFLVNESRRRGINLSKDVYAGDWINSESKTVVSELWDDYSNEVYPHDDIELGIRNRYFLEQLEVFSQENENFVFLNIGAGFTSYQYLLQQDRFSTIEVDLASLSLWRQQRASELTDSGILPKRNVRYLTLDLSKVGNIKKLGECINLLKDMPVFILIEGMSYYLPEWIFSMLMKEISSNINSNSVMCLDFWSKQNQDHPVLKRTYSFFEKKFRFLRTDFNLLDEENINFPGLQVVQKTNVYEQEIKFSNEPILCNQKLTLPEFYLLLKKNGI